MGLSDDDFEECPNCGNTEPGLSIYECPNCEFQGCYTGGVGFLFVDVDGCYKSAECPRCGCPENGKRIGKIVSG